MTSISVQRPKMMDASVKWNLEVLSVSTTTMFLSKDDFSPRAGSEHDSPVNNTKEEMMLADTTSDS
jgi:hypothetical protein